MVRPSGLTRHRRWLDLSVILGVMAGLVGNHRLGIVTPEWILARGHPATDIYLSYPASVTHLSTGHLLGNLAGYLVAATLGYYLCVRSGVARWYYASFAVILLVVPPVANRVTYGVFGALRPEYAFVVIGFSDVVGAFVGFLFVALFAALSATVPVRSVLAVAAVGVLASALELLWVASGGGNLLAVALAGTAVAGGGLVAVWVLADTTRSAGRWPSPRGQLGTYLVLFAIHSALLLGLFPTVTPDLVASVGVFSHLVGLLVGVGIAVFLAVVFDVFPTRRHLLRLGLDPDSALQLPGAFLAASLGAGVAIAAALAGAAVALDPGVQPAAIATDLLLPFGLLATAGWFLLLASGALSDT